MRNAFLIALTTVSVAWSLLARSASGADCAGIVETNASYTGLLKCGQNALFQFLILSGYSDITLEQFDNLPIHSDGVSLLTLHQAAQQVGIKSEVRRYRLQDLDSLRLPAIAVFNSGGDPFTSNHFTVIYKVEKERMYFIDGTTGLPGWLPRSPRLSRFWTGIALTPKTLFGIPGIEGWPIVVIVCLILLNFFVIVSVIRRGWPVHRMDRNPADVRRT